MHYMQQTMTKSSTTKSLDEQLADVREVLLEERKRRGLTQATVAHALGLSTSQYSRIESGSTEMTLRQFLAACDVVQIDPTLALRSSQPRYLAELQDSNRVLKRKLDAITQALKGDKDTWDK
ncbi:MAG: helix-turn-helix domain-containing protein [Hyphomicrobium sp.]